MSSSFDQMFDKVSSSKPGSGSSFDTLFDEVSATIKPKKSTYRQFKDTPEDVIRGAGSAVVSTPRTLTGLLKHGSEALAQKGREQAESEGREITEGEKKFTDFIVNALGYPEELLEKMGLPTYEEASEWHKKNSPTSGAEEFEPSDFSRGAETAGSILGTSAITPFSSFGTPTRAATTGLTALGAGGAEAMGASEGEAAIAGLTLPMAMNMLNMIRKGKFAPKGAEAKELYDFLKKEGLSEAEVAPILQSSRKVRVVGSLAGHSQRGAKAIQASETALGRVYDRAKETAKQIPRATTKQESKLIHRLQGVVDDMKKSKIISSDKESAIKKIEDMMLSVADGGIGADEIIATWQDVNSAVNWNSFKTGKKSLMAVKEPMSELLRELSPSVARDFERTNRAWGSLQNVARKVEATQFQKVIKYAEVGATVKGVYDYITTGDTRLLKGLALKKGTQYLATEMLINPRLHNLTGKMLAATRSSSKQAVIKAVRDFEEEVRKLDKKKES